MIAQLAAQKVHNSWNRKTMMEELNHKAPRGLGMLNPKDLYLSSQHYIRDVSINTVNLGNHKIVFFKNDAYFPQDWETL